MLKATTGRNRRRRAPGTRVQAEKDGVEEITAVSIFDPTGPRLSDLAPAPMWPWPLASTQQQCDHCYCKDVPADPSNSEYVLVDSPEPHKRCCQCRNIRAARFVGLGGRAVG